MGPWPTGVFVPVVFVKRSVSRRESNSGAELALRVPYKIQKIHSHEEFMKKMLSYCAVCSCVNLRDIPSVSDIGVPVGGSCETLRERKRVEVKAELAWRVLCIIQKHTRWIHGGTFFLERCSSLCRWSWSCRAPSPPRYGPWPTCGFMQAVTAKRCLRRRESKSELRGKTSTSLDAIRKKSPSSWSRASSKASTHKQIHGHPDIRWLNWLLFKLTANGVIFREQQLSVSFSFISSSLPKICTVLYQSQDLM